jgi:hypothetical protein
MLIRTAVRQLGHIDATELTRVVLAVEESQWREDPRRQHEYDVHAQTQSLILLFCDGWPQLKIERAPGWSLLAHQALPVMSEVIARFYREGGVILRAMIARLPPNARILRHKDAHPSFSAAHRIHVPLVTNPDVEFIVGSERITPRENYAFELNNHMFHEVINNGDRARLHFIFDYAMLPRGSAG